MPWPTYFLWAALVLLAIDLIHFTYQRKLNDFRTILLYAMLGNSALLCICGITMTSQLNQRAADSVIVLITSTILYLCQLLLPFLFYCLICLHLKSGISREIQIGLIPLAIGTCCILSNPFTGIIAFAESDGLWHIGNGYPFFTYGILCWYFFDFLFACFHYRKLKKQFFSLTEISLILIIGIIMQSILRKQMVIGFAAVLAITVIHLTLQNVYAYIDFITRVFNQNYFHYWMAERYSRHRKTPVIVIDFLQLEHIHNIHGLGTDSKLLTLLANKLWEITPHHQVFRLSFNRFILCTDSEVELQHLYKKLHNLFQQEFEVFDFEVNCPAILYQIPDIFLFNNVDTLLAYIEFSLQNSCGISPDEPFCSTQALYNDFVYEREIERFLPEAVEKDLFEVWFQPIYSVKEKRFVALEALSRLKHPELGWVSPELFIRIAAKNNLLFQIMPMQLEKICRFLQNHPQGLQRINNVKMNLSPSELTKSRYCESLVDIIKKYQIAPERFQFEVTETAATKYTKELSHCIQVLSQAGIQLCLDDFGSGYANLSSILKLPFAVIKMDRSLLFGICEEDRSRLFYHNMVSTLKNIGYKIVAEGVETSQEAQFMADWDVDLIQGYYYSRPLPPDSLLELLAKDCQSTSEKCFLEME